MGGINVPGSIGNVTGDMVGGDKVRGDKVGGDKVGGDKITVRSSRAELDDALRPLVEAVKTAPAEKQAEANAKVAALKEEAAKGKDANDGVIAKLVDGLVGLVPGAASAVVSAFATPILGPLAGGATTFVLDKLQGK
jgi:hypothetical protein